MRRLIVWTGVAVLVGAVAPAATAVTTEASADATAPSVWSLATVPAPDGAALRDGRPWDDTLDCPAPTWCELLTNSRYVTTLDGHTATTVDPPEFYTQPYLENALNDVACGEPGDCVATGESYEGPWDTPSGYRDELKRGTWRAQKGTGAWEQVDCNPDGCVEIGTVDVGIELGNLDDRATGGRWVERSLSTPWQDNGTGIGLTAAACPPSGACYVIGHGTDQDDTTRSLFFSRSGSGWRGVPIVEPRGAVPGSAYLGLFSAQSTLTCPAANECMALGEYTAQPTGKKRLFTESYSNGRLSATPVPLPAAPSGYGLEDFSLSCASMSYCAATVGLAEPYHGSSQVLLRLRAGAWSHHALVAPTGAGASPYVAAVSCPSNDNCVAVGGFFRGTGSRTVRRPAVWTWTRSNWTVQGLGRPPGIPADTDGSLDTVECNSNRCAASGSYGDYAVVALGRLSG